MHGLEEAEHCVLSSVASLPLLQSLPPILSPDIPVAPSHKAGMKHPPQGCCVCVYMCACVCTAHLDLTPPSQGSVGAI